MEMGSTYAKLMIETLLNVHGLCNMHRSSDNDEHRKVAAQWIPTLDDLYASLKRELTKAAPVPLPQIWTVRVNPDEDEVFGPAFDVLMPNGEWRTCIAVDRDDALNCMQEEWWKECSTRNV